MSISILILLYFAVIITSFFLFKFEWIIRTIRETASQHNQGGYTKLMQIGMIIFLVSIFTAVVIYFFFNPEEVNGINIILTVVVGWLGAIIGQFFGEKTMENLYIKKKEGITKVSITDEKRVRVIERIENIIQEYDIIINKYNKRIKRMIKLKK